MSVVVLREESLAKSIDAIIADAMALSPAGAARAQNLPVVDQSTFDWNKVTEKNWFVCENGKKCYYFPMYLPENRADNYARVKSAMHNLGELGWTARQME
jgi:hypothetical protein